MMLYIFKSAICLTLLYTFYWFCLRNTRSFLFNRFFLLFSLLFSFAVPLISLGPAFNFARGLNIDFIFHSKRGKGVSVGVQGVPAGPFLSQQVLWIIYFVISLLFLMRYAVNILRIALKISSSDRIDYSGATIILVKDKASPHSFMRYIFVNKEDYESGIIENKLLAHEHVHCTQYHSVDMLVVELFKIIFWFNPLIWIFSKTIQLNHEYLADNSVLQRYEKDDYQNTLLNIVFRNNSIYLASHFNYSSVKKRLLMMEKKRSDTMILRVILTIPLFLFLGLAFTSAQQTKVSKKVQEKQTDTLTKPTNETSKKKVIIKDGKTYFVTEDGKLIDVGDETVPPPPPPPPPVKDVQNADANVGNSDEQLSEQQLKQKEFEKQQKDEQMKQKELEKLQYDDQLKKKEYEQQRKEQQLRDLELKEKTLKEQKNADELKSKEMKEKETKAQQKKEEQLKVEKKKTEEAPSPPPPPPVK